MPRAGVVTELYRYPVKSMGGEPLRTARIDGARLRGDRAYALRTEGKLGSGKNSHRFRRVGGLLDVRARYDGDVPVMTFPDGRTLRGDDPGVDAALTGALDAPVRLVPEDGAVHVDVAPVHLVTTASLRWLSDHLPDARIAVPRFRPNIVVDVPGAEPAESAWVGRRLRIGGAELAVVEPTERCVMTTAAQGDLPHDARVLKTLADRSELMFGVYLDVVTPGDIATGDAVELV